MHFFPDDPADAVARKALRVNLSDLAAKGAKPAGFLLALALPKSVGDEWLQSFARGLGADAERYGCPLLGGDTVRTPGPLMVSITAFGMVPRGTMVQRSGAKAGDRILVSGTDRRRGAWSYASAAILRRPRDGASTRRPARTISRRAICLPQPRNALAEAVRAACLGRDGCVRRAGRRS